MTLKFAPPPPPHLLQKLAPPPPSYLLRAPAPPPHLLRAPPPPSYLLRAPAPPPHLLRAMSSTPRILQPCDTECYPNYWLIKFYDPSQPGVVTREFDMYPGKLLDIAGVIAELERSTIITFNGVSYDCPMIALALTGASCADMKAANDLIIVGKLKWWDFYNHYRLDRLEEKYRIDHIDVKEVAPGVNVSLKTYGGRGHSRKLQDLPIKPSENISPFQRVQLSTYCTNDLITTWELYQKCIKAINLRIAMTLRYGTDLRSKSDAQCAEAIFKAELGFKPQRAFWPHGTEIKFTAPAFIKFATPELQEVLRLVQAVSFYTSDKDQCEEVLDSNGNKIKTGIIMPPEIKSLKIKIGDMFYKMGIGGLHSMESAAHHIANKFFTLSDHDVASYYPSLILICGMFPQQLGEKFIAIYRAVYDERIEAKHLAQRIAGAIAQAKLDGVVSLSEMEEAYLVALAEADAKKIILNGTFGKLGSKYSILFAPNLLLQVTITGQLSLLMLIESLHLASIATVSANTDGIVIKTPTGYEFMRDSIIKHWEGVTGLVTEANSYAALYSRDVNNYIAYKLDGKHKAKGVFADAGITKNPTNSICVDAVVAYLGKGVPIETTIRGCTDVRRFLTIRNVKGNGVKIVHGELPYHTTREQLLSMAGFVEEFEGWRHNTWNTDHTSFNYIKTTAAYEMACASMRPIISSQYLGKVVRWYYGVGEHGCISYETNGNKVPKSEGAIPLMDLPDAMPGDVDYSRYEQETRDMLRTLGVVVQ